ncbi:hypothetical protein C4J97_3439 [Pseudomonas orientalis]|nr:hypothetical protein C4J97_3439 [Pseudomonas orientalis]
MAGNAFKYLEPWGINTIVVGEKDSLKSMTLRHGHAPSMLPQEAFGVTPSKA